MLAAKDFKRYAREALKGRWMKAGGVAVLASLIGANIQGGGVFSTAAGSYQQNSEIAGTVGNIPPEFFATVLGIGLFALLLALVYFIIGGAATLGYAKYTLNLVDDEEPRVKNLFSQFDRLWEGFLMQFLRGLYTFLWSLLFVIPGIIASYRYAMTPYILLENPEMTANEAITESKRMMVGNKWRLFCLELSFIGWLLLAACGVYPLVMLLSVGQFIGGTGTVSVVGAVVLVIGVIAYVLAFDLFLMPYMDTARAVFYREISEEKYSSPVLDAEIADEGTE